MSICCAFSFSLILLFGFGFFPWAGVGEACAGVVEYIYIYFILFFFFSESFFQSSWVSPLPAVPFCPGPPPGVCGCVCLFVCVSIAGAGRGPLQLLELWFRMPCLFLGLFSAPDLYLPKCSSLFPAVHAGHVL